MAVQSTPLLIADAKNRALRSFVQGLYVDLGVAVAVFVATAFFAGGVDEWGDLQWYTLSFTLFKTLMQTAASYVMRRFMDKSGVPTPLPPEPAVEPAEPVEDVPVLPVAEDGEL